MKTFLLIIFCIYFVLNAFGDFSALLHSKSTKEYIWRLFDVLISFGMIFAFYALIKLLGGIN